ncbi:MAG: hypothetical protein ABIA93_03695 [Candidatus Woesearchaeota archaeon]
MVSFKIKCAKCKNNYVLADHRTRFPVCLECQSKEMEGEVKDPEMKVMFDIPNEFYQQNSFLRDIKIKYLKWGPLSEKQIEAFKKTVAEMKARPKDA